MERLKLPQAPEEIFSLNLRKIRTQKFSFSYGFALNILREIFEKETSFKNILIHKKDKMIPFKLHKF